MQHPEELQSFADALGLTTRHGVYPPKASTPSPVRVADAARKLLSNEPEKAIVRTSSKQLGIAGLL